MGETVRSLFVRVWVVIIMARIAAGGLQRLWQTSRP
jgi:hypothetical protein